MGIKESRITYFDGSYYLGEVSSTGKQHGKGQIYYANGDHLKGTFVDGDCTFALVSKKNGDVYEGQMRDIRYHGQGKLTVKNETWNGLFRGGIFMHGRIQFEDGSTYSGSIEKGSKSGYGEYKHPDGTRYRGYFKNDKFEGKGELEKKDGTKYNGTFRSGEFDGHGVLVKFQRGKKSYEYEGYFYAGDFDGEGVLTYGDGNHFQGQFKNGKKNGKGIFKYANGDVYEGNFVDDIKEDTNCSFRKANGTKYNGGIRNNQYNGRGRLEKENGEYYEGEFLDGHKNGHGILRTSQFIYEGEFLNNQKHGKAKLKYFDEDNSQFQGFFNNGKMHGVCIEKSDKQYSEITYNEGVKNGPYKKRIGKDYEEQGTFENDVRHGKVRIRKGNETAIYQFTQGNRGEIIG